MTKTSLYNVNIWLYAVADIWLMSRL